MSHTVRNKETLKRSHIRRQLREQVHEKEKGDQLRLAKRGVYEA